MEQIGVAKIKKPCNSVVLCLLLLLISIAGCQTPPPPPAPLLITIEGKGSEVIRDTGSTIANKSCLNVYTTAVVAVGISGGTVKNSITGSALCNKLPGASASVTDLGTGVATSGKGTGPTVTGVATCTHVYTGVNDSRWLVTCEFF